MTRLRITLLIIVPLGICVAYGQALARGIRHAFVLARIAAEREIETAGKLWRMQ
jgi:hypothetical protein